MMMMMMMIIIIIIIIIIITTSSINAYTFGLTKLISWKYLEYFNDYIFKFTMKERYNP